jgi:hypothetical protein
MDEGFFADGTNLYLRLRNKRVPDNTDTIRIPRYTTGITVSGKQYLQIRGLEICYYGRDDYSRGIYFDGASYNLVDSCSLHHSGIGVAFKRACRSNTVQHCTFTEGPIDTWNWSAVKEGTGYYEAGGVVVYGSSAANTGNVIRFNRMIHMFDGSHLYSDDDAGPTTDMDFHDNYIEFVNDDCIETDGAGSNCRIYNNTFRTFLTGVSVAPAAGGPTYIIRNTFSGWETHSGYVGYPVKFNVDSDMSIDWVYLYHNTCHTGTAGQPGFLFKQYSNWNHVVSRNNIFSGTDYALESASDSNPVDFDYDDLFTTSAGKIARWDGSTFTTLAAFSTATGQELHGRNLNPEFTAAATGDFRLAAGSKLIDAGVVIAGVNDDYLGEQPDIGRYESGSQTVLGPRHRRAAEHFPIIVAPGNRSGTVFIRTGPISTGKNSAILAVFNLSGKTMGRITIPAGQTGGGAAFQLGKGVYTARVYTGEAQKVRLFVVR